ncbi:MAG: hypothetical protein WHU54_04285 [Candidatus Bathyarchaeia archaeon]
MATKTRTNMYANVKTWNPFVGCNHDCVYCDASFQRQLKRWAKSNCKACYNFTPHYHPDRLRRLPSAETIFVCGNGDIAFCETSFIEKIVDRITEHYARSPEKTYYFQSKNWASASRLLPLLEDKPFNAIILETLETNRDEGYRRISKAPMPSQRHKTFLELNHLRKVITAEPLLDFDVDVFFEMIAKTEPEYVWIGYNSKPALISLPEPTLDKTKQLIKLLKSSGLEVRGKELRGLTV